MQITVLDNQNYQDLAIQLTGDVSNALLIAKANKQSPSDDITAGSLLDIPEELKKDEDIVNYYTTNNVLPATGLSEESTAKLIGKEGIDYWILGNDFKVS